MAINRQDSRHRIKRTNLTGVVPTAHTASTDFTDGTWLNTDIREAEFFYNIPDKKLWIGTGTSSIEIAQIGSTTSGNSLEQTLSIGNNSGTNNIIMGTATTIKSLNGGGQIELDSISNGGGPGSIYLSTDSGGYAETGMFLEPGNGAYIYSYDGAVVLESNSSNISFIESGINSRQLRISTPWLSVLNDSIFIKDNSISSVTSSNTNKASVSISSQNSSFQSGIYNSVILGGYGIIATHSNSVYVPDLYIQSGKSIKSLNGGGQIDLDAYGKAVSISTDNGALSKAYVYLEDAMLLLGVPNRNIYLGDNGIQIASPTASILISSGGYFGVNVNDRTFKFDMTQNAAASTTTLASIPMSNDQTLTIQVVLNAYCASPNRNLGITMMASFLKYGGTIYQTGTTNSIVKDGFGDGSTATIDTDGTNVRIRITNGSGLTTNWAASYDYLLT